MTDGKYISQTAAFLRYLVGVSEKESPQYVEIIANGLEQLRNGQIKKRTDLLKFVTGEVERTKPE